MCRIKTIGVSALIAGCLATAAVAESGASSGAITLAQSSALTHAVAERCAGLQATSHRWPDSSTRITAATWHSADSKVNTPAGPVSLPAHCEVTGLLRERTGKDAQSYAIRFHLRLPEAWNQRFFFQGGGGTNGELGDALGPISMGTPNALQRGYAVVSQDSGHDNARNSLPERGGPVAFGFDPQARSDYGGASLEPVALAAKAIIGTYYGRGPERSYFVGCSKGGQEGMVFAQRHPEQFDGIVASAPGFSLPRAAVAEAWDIQAFASLIPGENPSPGKLPATFTNEQFARVRNAVLAACDADDGARDGITANWAACEWSRVEPQLQKEVCTTSADCLSAEQVKVIGRVYSGAKDSKGQSLYASWPLDGGIGSDAWRVWKIGPPGGPFPGINVAMGAPALAAIFTTPPKVVRADLAEAFDFALQFDFDRDAPKIYATDRLFTRSAWEDVAARSTDLRKFRARGAKMVVPHGVSDPVFSINDTVAWFREVDRLNDGRAADFVRVFPVPGMAHCSGGPATDQFNAFDALVDWVERGAPPDRLIATAGPASPWPGRTRPLCPYPKVARYSGTGSLEDAAQFRCE